MKRLKRMLAVIITGSLLLLETEQLPIVRAAEPEENEIVIVEDDQDRDVDETVISEESSNAEEDADVEAVAPGEEVSPDEEDIAGQDEEIIDEPDAPEPDQDASANWYKDYEYEINNEYKTIKLKKWKSNKTEAEIKSEVVINGITYAVQLYNSVFQGCDTIKKIIIREKVKLLDGYKLFCFCRTLEELDISGLETSEVTDMSYMFYSLGNLKKLDVSSLDTSKVRNMESMFGYLGALTYLDVSSLKTSNVWNMSYMFNGCRNLKNLDVSHFDTSNVELIGSMFCGCKSLTTLDVSHFDSSKMTSLTSMFRGCKSLTTLDVTHFDFSNVRSIIELFYGCESLTALDLSSFDLKNSPYTSDLLTGCVSLNYLKTPVNVNDTIKIPAGLELMDENGTKYTVLPTGEASKESIVLRSGAPAKIAVSQADGVYGTALEQPVYVKPVAGGTETISYQGTCTKDNSKYGPTETAPELPGTYTVSVNYQTDTLTYSGSAEFVIRKADGEDCEKKCLGSAGEDGRYELAALIKDGAALGNITIVSGREILEGTPHITGASLLEWRIKAAARYINVTLIIPVTGADNYTDYSIRINIIGGSYGAVDGAITLNGEKVASLQEALGRMTDSNTDYLINIGADIKGEKDLTIPKTASAVIIIGNGHTVEITGTKLTANTSLTLDNIRIKALNKQGGPAGFTLLAKKDLYIAGGVAFNAAGVTVKGNGRTVLSGGLEAKKIIFKDLLLDQGAVLKVLPGSNITINGLLKGNGGQIELANGFDKPVNIKGSVEGTISIIGAKQKDGTQILKCSPKKIDANTLKKAFNVSAITDNTIDTYLYYFSSGKAAIFGEAISYNGQKYGLWKDAVAAMNAEQKAMKKYNNKYVKYLIIELSGDVNMNGSFKFPNKGYELFVIEGNDHCITFTGDIKLSGDTVINNTDLNKVDKKGNSVPYKMKEGKYDLYFNRNY